MAKNINNIAAPGSGLFAPKKFSGQTLLVQVLHLIPSHIIEDAVKTFEADSYSKKPKTCEHLALMLFGVITGRRFHRDKVNSLIMSGNKCAHFNLSYMPWINRTKLPPSLPVQRNLFSGVKKLAFAGVN